MKLLLVLAAAATVALASEGAYTGYRVINVHVPDWKRAHLLMKYQNSYDFWGPVVAGRDTQIMVPPTKRHFPELLQKLGFNTEVSIENVQDLIDYQDNLVATRDERQGSWFEQYHTYDEVIQFLSDTAATYATASTETIGTSFEGRDMVVMKICEGGVCGNNPAMWMECNLHAREWVSEATCLWFINELTANAAANSAMLTGLDWYFLTPANPDGYAWTWTGGLAREWRKTRKPNAQSSCIGTDPNRNWWDHWDEGGASDNECSNTWHGYTPFSEPCVQNIAAFVQTHPEIVYFHDLHAYSQLIMFPYGYSHTNCADHDELMALCNAGNVALQATHGEDYECGSIADVIYIASGSSVDWAYDKAGIKYSFTIECRDKGLYGFLLPEDQIAPNAEEIFAFHEVIAAEMIAQYPNGPPLK